MLNDSLALDRAFQALADPVRRGMLAALSRGPASVSELAAPLPISLPAVLQHLQALEASGLIRTEKKGRVRTCRLEPEALSVADILDRRPARPLGSPARPLRRPSRRHHAQRRHSVTASTDLRLERLLDAPRDLVWKAWTDPEHIKRWWAPRPYETPECEIDLRTGGKFRTLMTGPEGFHEEGTACILESSPASGSSGPAHCAMASGPTASRPRVAAPSRSPRSTRSRTPATARPATPRPSSTGTRKTPRPTPKWASTTAGAPAPIS